MSSLEEEGCGKSLYLPDGDNLPGRPQNDQKMIEN